MKHKIASIHFPFSESGNKRLEKTFLIWDEAEKALRDVKPPDLGYYKTDFVITYENGETYSGRFDIGCDSETLRDHILNHVSFVCKNKYGRMTKEQIQDYQDFPVKYQIG